MELWRGNGEHTDTCSRVVGCAVRVENASCLKVCVAYLHHAGMTEDLTDILNLQTDHDRNSVLLRPLPVWGWPSADQCERGPCPNQGEPCL